MGYGEQLARKEAVLRAALARYASLAHLEVPSVVGSPRAFGYRNQAKLVARRGRDGVRLGMYRPGTHQVVDIPNCPIHDAMINRVLGAVRTELERFAVPIFDERRGQGWLRYVVVRVSAANKAAHVILVVTGIPGAGGEGFAGWRALGRAIRQIRGVAGVVLNVNEGPGNVILGPTFVPFGPERPLVERVGPLRLRSQAGSFLQANIPAARRVYQRVLALADPRPEETVVDLYAGVGAISLYLAARAGFVCGIEESPTAVVDAKMNVRLNGFHNVRFFQGTTANVLPALRPRLERVDVVTLNPPRKGADEATRTAICSAAPSRVAYVSCDPSTLARDLDWFAARGYDTQAVQPFDLFPQTEHVESVALLRARGTSA